MSDTTGITSMLGEIQTPEQLGALVDQVDDDNIIAVVKTAGVAPILDRIFGEMANHFKPESAGGTKAEILWNIGLGDETHPYHVDIADGKCTASAGSLEAARVSFTISLPDFLRLVSGRLNPVAAFTGGKLTMTGDLAFAMSVQNLFVI